MIGQNQNKKALVVVAHCDDAVLWMGGVIHYLGDWEWHILSMCNGNNDEKIKSFNESCQKLGVRKYQALNFVDYQCDGVFSKNKKEEMKSELMKWVDGAYDYAFSHNLRLLGEYGRHDNHQEVGIITSEIAAMNSWQFIQFCYKPLYRVGDIATVADNEADYYFQLDYETLKSKLELIDCFPQEMGSLGCLAYPCPNPEAFKVDILPIPPFVRRQ